MPFWEGTIKRLRPSRAWHLSLWTPELSRLSVQGGAFQSSPSAFISSPFSNAVWQLVGCRDRPIRRLAGNHRYFSDCHAESRSRFWVSASRRADSSLLFSNASSAALKTQIMGSNHSINHVSQTERTFVSCKLENLCDNRISIHKDAFDHQCAQRRLCACPFFPFLI